MTRICPKCNYARKETDSAPEWQCPSCQVAYNKAHSAPASDAYRSKSGSAPATYHDGSRRSFASWLALAGLAAAGYGLYRRYHSLGSNSENSETADSSQPEIILYGTEWCGYCNAARRLFDANHIAYQDIDIEKDMRGKEAHEKLGGGGVPVFVIDGQVVHGYNEQSMRRALGPWMR